MQESQSSNSLPEPKRKSRGHLIRSLGIASFTAILGVFLLIIVPFSDDLRTLLLWTFLLLAPLLGIPAWIVGTTDLKEIRNGSISVSSMPDTKMGRTFGICGTLVGSIMLLIVTMSYLSSSTIAPEKDAMINDFNNLAAHAYQYRIRGQSKSGASGSYAGYVIPPRVSRNSTGIYTAKVLHADTIQFKGVWINDSTATITVKAGPDGRLRDWLCTGDFQ